ncbi:TetR/AcrR family transcriptional regulator [Actinokineospora sp. NBRC 105648]|uniref:TetR/AcrR family transcriptional regulator n=1 Tax=Actinokineospora sp. NBRC 105648 TaxID=3032206 RepID=UPI0024A193D0|nr:TetR/AcrR family transcriptional regulator [Actinokineospora sp. NBRC 105648]GLZ37077.1 TetR family transcriptional regulator [Actinokineospora sp. NBRC 105648]
MRQDARDNRERILGAAEEVFGAHGAAGSTEEVARLARVGIATVFRHFPTKEALIEAALLRHFDHLTDRATALASGADPAVAWRTLVRAMIETGATKLTLASMLTTPDHADRGGLPNSAAAASNRLKAAVSEVLRRAQDAGAVRPSVAIDEVYLLIRGLAQVAATTGARPDTLDRAIDVVLTGLSLPAR